MRIDKEHLCFLLGEKYGKIFDRFFELKDEETIKSNSHEFEDFEFWSKSSFCKIEENYYKVLYFCGEKLASHIQFNIDHFIHVNFYKDYIYFVINNSDEYSHDTFYRENLVEKDNLLSVLEGEYIDISIDKDEL